MQGPDGKIPRLAELHGLELGSPELLEVLDLWAPVPAAVLALVDKWSLKGIPPGGSCSPWPWFLIIRKRSRLPSALTRQNQTSTTQPTHQRLYGTPGTDRREVNGLLMED
jgi:hypothetical protein